MLGKRNGNRFKNMIAYLIPMSFLLLIFGMLMLNNLKVDGDVSLTGAVVSIEEPMFAFEDIMTGSYQAQYDNWFKSHFPFRNLIIKSYGEVKYRVFDKSPVATVIKGKNGDLYQNWYVNTPYNRVTKKQDQQIEDFVKKLSTLQTVLEKNNKMFYYLITATKSDIYTENIPKQYKKNGEVENNYHNRIIYYCEKYGVNYFDTTETGIRLKNESEKRLFPYTGTHWNYYFAGYAVQDFFKKINNHYSANLPVPNVEVIESQLPLGADTDIYDLMNLFTKNYDSNYYDVNLDYGNFDSASLPYMVRFGTSFQYQLNYVLKRGSIFENQIKYGYIKNVQRAENGVWSGNEIENNDISQIDFERIYNDGDLFIFENTSSLITEPHEIILSSFLEYLNMYEAELSKENCDIEILNIPERIKISPGAVGNLDLKVKNNTNFSLPNTGTKPFRLSYHIKDKDGEMLQWEGIRTNLDNKLMPDQEQILEFTFEAPKQSGEYFLSITAVQEHVAWLDGISRVYPIDVPLVVE